MHRTLIQRIPPINNSIRKKYRAIFLVHLTFLSLHECSLVPLLFVSISNSSCSATEYPRNILKTSIISCLFRRSSITQQLQLGSSQLLDKVDCHDVLVLGTRVAISDTARDLGVVIDRELSLAAHATAVCRSGYNQLRQLRPVVRSLSMNAIETLVKAFISCRLDYCNSLLYGISDGTTSTPPIGAECCRSLGHGRSSS